MALSPGHLLEVFQLFWKASGGFLLVWVLPRGGAWDTGQMVVFACGPFLETIAPYGSSNRKSEDKELDNIFFGRRARGTRLMG